MDINSLSLSNRNFTFRSNKEKKISCIKKGERFLKGPIPWDWLCVASRIPGKSLNVAIAIWHLSGFKRSRTIALSGSVLRQLGVKGHSGYHALKALEDARLINVVRHPGRNPIVTILNGGKNSNHKDD